MITVANRNQNKSQLRCGIIKNDTDLLLLIWTNDFLPQLKKT